MNHRLFSFAFIFFFSLVTASVVQAQAHAGEHMDNISSHYGPVQKSTWDYLVAVSNNRSAKTIDKRRTELITSINTARNAISRVKPWEGDASLRDSAVAFLKMSDAILNNDFAKIIDLEEVAEQSFDAMEAYMIARKKANEKYKSAAARLRATSLDFASRHNVTLIEDENDKLSDKIQKADTVLSYHDRVFLIMFKSQIQETYVMDALAKGDVSGAEQNKNKLVEVATDGLKQLGSIPSFNGDASLKTATQELVTFLKNEGATKFPILIDFYLKKENFEKIKAATEAKGSKNLTQADTDAYNKAVDEYNKAVASYNKTNDECNATRAKLVNAWNAASQAFTARHVPNK